MTKEKGIFANMFKGGENKKVPQTFEECYQQDKVSSNLWIWAKRLETLGAVLLVALAVIGIGMSIQASFVDEVASFSSYTYTETVFHADILFTSLITWALYAFLEYCAYHILALFIGSLGSIVQNTNISANVALYNSAKAEGAAKESQGEKESGTQNADEESK